MQSLLPLTTQRCAEDLKSYNVYITIYRRGIEYGEKPMKYRIGQDQPNKLQVDISPKKSSVSDSYSGKIIEVKIDPRDAQRSDDELAAIAIDQYIGYYRD